MSAPKAFHLRGGGRVTQTFLPFDADLDALYPDRMFLVETQTGMAWAVGATETDGLLPVLDERQDAANRPVQSRDELITLLGFKPVMVEGETDSVTIDVFVKVSSALIHESVKHKMGQGSDGGAGSRPAAPPAPPRIEIMKRWSGLSVLTVTDKVFKA